MQQAAALDPALLPGARRRRIIGIFEPWGYVSPGLAVVILIMLVPLAVGIMLSFQNYDIIRPAQRGYVGLENYVKLWGDRNFWRSLRNTLSWTLWCVGLQFALGLILALLLYRPFRGRGIYQVLVFLPWAVPSFLAALNWQWMFNPLISPMPSWMAAMGMLDEPRNILADPKLALFGPITAMVWWGIPFFTITLLAVLRSIPEELYEAADIDGANSRQKFWHITLPFLLPMIAITVMLRTVWVANFPDMIFVMTGGGPANTTQILSSYVFTTAYRALKFGYASALASALMMLLVVYAAIILYLRSRLQQ